MQLTWSENPKPFLTSVGSKAGGKKSAVDGLFSMIWDASDLELFNESSNYDAIIIYQDGIVHKKHSDNYLGISHITVDGRAGDLDVKVPDYGSALVLLDIGLAGVLF
ncbi:hypothetical protein [Pelagicoccus sp. SDUM812002]|uniref:hypothetical protein n=1 Tax=Pelagicoccus sp. SDUM812002 TaxID=3041266 RepID=UPI0028102076|nr:hypothetical protein [Pelagicoccus sp. SDUM812002]MDQ8185330.1 hypothetical protein [Pelagicoccus sp. SDUM812002]